MSCLFDQFQFSRSLSHDWKSPSVHDDTFYTIVNSHIVWQSNYEPHDMRCTHWQSSCRMEWNNWTSMLVNDDMLETSVHKNIIYILIKKRYDITHWHSSSPIESYHLTLTRVYDYMSATSPSNVYTNVRWYIRNLCWKINHLHRN